MSTVQVGSRPRVEVAVNATDLPGNVTQNFLAPDDGFVNELAVIIQATVTTGGTLKVQNAAGADIPGLVVTVPNGAAAGTIVSAKATKGALERACVRDGRLRLVPTGFATAGAARAYVTVATNDNPQMPY